MGFGLVGFDGDCGVAGLEGFLVPSGQAEQLPLQGVVGGRFGTVRWVAACASSRSWSAASALLAFELPGGARVRLGGGPGRGRSSMARSSRAKRLLGPPEFAVEVGQGDVGVEPGGVDGDRPAEVGHRVARPAPFEPDQAAVRRRKA